MWQRFTERARKIIFYAQEEAGKRGENYVSTSYLLLGVLRERDSVAMRMLAALTIDDKALRQEVLASIPEGDGIRKSDMQLTANAKHVIDLAYEEARLLDNNYIGSEHLLLGILRQEGEPDVVNMLCRAGLEMDAVRETIVRLQTGGATKSQPLVTNGQTGFLSGLLDEARRLAQSTGHSSTLASHLLLALLTAKTGSAARLIERLSADITATVQRLRDDIAGPPLKELPPISDAAFAIFAEAPAIARSRFSEARASSDHLLLAFTLQRSDETLMLEAIGLGYRAVHDEMLRMRDDEV